VLVVTERGSEFAGSYEAFLMAMLKTALTELVSGVKSSASTLPNPQLTSGANLRAIIASFYTEENYHHPDFSVLNVVDGVKRQIGTVSRNRYIEFLDAAPVFPGWTDVVP
jgi:hypothetical protein